MLPRIADVKCQRIKFEPGDRILVRCFHQLDPRQEKHLKQSIERWAGNSVEVLVINPANFELHIDQSGRRATR